jgi:hypothetical protein
MPYVDWLLAGSGWNWILSAAGQPNAWLYQLLFIELILLMMSSKPALNM